MYPRMGQTQPQGRVEPAKGVAGREFCRVRRQYRFPAARCGRGNRFSGGHCCLGVLFARRVGRRTSAANHGYLISSVHIKTTETIMKNLKLAFATCALLSFGLLSSPAQARSYDEVVDSGTINVVTTASSPPHGFMDPKTNSLQGIMVDVARGIGKHLGLTVKFINVTFSGLIRSEEHTSE